MFFLSLGSLFTKNKIKKINPNNKRISMTPTSKTLTLNDPEYYELTKNINTRRNHYDRKFTT
jgi:hypothetical protein